MAEQDHVHFDRNECDERRILSAEPAKRAEA
jgi:hypothetical protein